MNPKHHHTPDEVDALMTALGKLGREQGDTAFWAACPDGWREPIRRLAAVRNIGDLTAAEILLRVGRLVERETNDD